MRYWPFLTGRSRHTGHRVIVVPDLLTTDEAQQLFGALPAPEGGLPSKRAEVLRREIPDSPVGPVTIFYVVREAPAEDVRTGGVGPLHDEYGRRILLTEGIVVQGMADHVPAGALRAALDDAHASVIPAFRAFWERDEEFDARSVAARHSDFAGDGDVTVVDVVSRPRQTGRRRGQAPAGRFGRNRVLAGVFVVLVGLVAGVVGWQIWPSECGGVLSGYRLNDGVNKECIGITDGRYLFNDPRQAANDDDRKTMERINDVQAMIADENDDVVAGDRYVKVVLVMPLTVSHARPSAMSLEQILHSLEGSYTALMRVNHTKSFGDPSAVKVQLLLANQGSELEASDEFVDIILDESEPEHPVVAVVGLGVSRANTKDLVEKLAQRGIPMVSAIASADTLTNLPLLWSVSPSDTDYVRALSEFLDGQDVLNSGAVVVDENPDLYTESLAAAYHTQLGSYINYPDQRFRGSTISSAAAPTVFDPVVRNLCNAMTRDRAPLEMVFFAGRGADFGEFVEALAARPCLDQRLAILIGSSELGPVAARSEFLTGINLGMIDVALSSSLGAHGDMPGLTEFKASYVRYVSPTEIDLEDGFGIAYHDALVTAAQAVRIAAADQGAGVPDALDVLDGFGYLHLAHEVPAASGTLSFPPEGGRAIGQLITVRES